MDTLDELIKCNAEVKEFVTKAIERLSEVGVLKINDIMCPIADNHAMMDYLKIESTEQMVIAEIMKIGHLITMAAIANKSAEDVGIG